MAVFRSKGRRRLCITVLFLLSSSRMLLAQTGLTLQNAIEQAKTSLLAHEAEDQVDAFKGAAKQAGLGPNPRLYIQSEDNRPWTSDFNIANATEYAYLGQTFELDRKRTKRKEVAYANVRRSEAERTLVEQQIAGRVAGAYWTAVVSAGVAKLFEEDMTVVDEMVRYHQKRVDAGAMRGVDLLRMQIERDRIVIALETARREAALARIELARQIGRSLSSGEQLTDVLDKSLPVQTQAIATVLAARADVAVARQTVSAAEAEIRLQKAIGVPDLDLFGGLKRNLGTNTVYAGLQMPLPIRNRNQGEIARAEANHRLAQDQLRQVEFSVRVEVDAAQEAYSRQRTIIETILPDMRARAQKNLAIMSDAYKTGGVDLLRFIDAERTAIDIEVNALRSLAEFQLSGLRLLLANGVRP
jgi:cobalt-zinc-cadmium efflux system outer membrane protein